MTDKQHRILTFIKAFIHEHQYPPTQREIGDVCGISSTSVVSYNLSRLEALGMIVRDAPQSARAIRVLRKGEAA